MPHHKNALLSRLEPKVFARLEPSVIELPQGEVLGEVHQQIEKVYFPHSGIISCVVELIGGGAIETGMIGNDGVFGGAQALDGKVSLNHVVMQVKGTVSIANLDKVAKLAEEFVDFRRLLVAYEQFFLAQVQQTAACNAAHNVQARTCKWLLRMHHLVGTELHITQEFLAQMMGVRRTSVTQVAQELQRAGMITYARGKVQIVDLDQIRRAACECNDDIQSHFNRLFPPQSPSDSGLGDASGPT